MRLTADYHTHTIFSHGKNTVEDNVQAAVKRGLKTVGIADHSVSHVLYGVKRRRLGEYISCIKGAQRKYEDVIKVKTGIELNLIGLDGSVDVPDEDEFDIRILGYHKAAMCRDIATAWRFFAGKRSATGKDAITKAYIRAIKNGGIDILAHPGYGVPIDYEQIGKACADYGVLFEINNKHTELTKEDILTVASTGATFVLSSDAHAAQNVGIATHALDLVVQAGLNARQVANAEEE